MNGNEFCTHTSVKRQLTFTYEGDQNIGLVKASFSMFNWSGY